MSLAMWDVVSQGKALNPAECRVGDIPAFQALKVPRETSVSMDFP